MRKSITTQLLLSTIALLLTIVLVYMGISLSSNSLKHDESNTSKTTIPTAVANYQDRAVELSKVFAIAYFNGTAFVSSDIQPVVDSYKEYLNIELGHYREIGDSPLGGGVVSFGDFKFIPESDQGSDTYAVWLITKIKTRAGLEKTVIFITRVKVINQKLVIDTAGAIPYIAPLAP